MRRFWPRGESKGVSSQGTLRVQRVRGYLQPKKNSEDAFHDTENMDVQRTMDESHTSWRRILQILNMRYYHAVL